MMRILREHKDELQTAGLHPRLCGSVARGGYTAESNVNPTLPERLKFSIKPEVLRNAIDAF